METLDKQLVLFSELTTASSKHPDMRDHATLGEEPNASHAPAAIVSLIALLASVGGGTWLVGLAIRALFIS